MNPEMYIYTLVVALIGMLTVFIGLTLLSIMMVLLRRLFGNAPTHAPAPTPLKAVRRQRPESKRWVLAAVAAYLAVEEREHDRSAASWVPDTSTDQWTVQPKL